MTIGGIDSWNWAPVAEALSTLGGLDNFISSSKKLLVAPGIATSSKDAASSKCISIGNKKLLVTMHLTTRSKKEATVFEAVLHALMLT